MSDSSTEYQAYKWCDTAQCVDNTGRITFANVKRFMQSVNAQTISNQTWSKVNVTSFNIVEERWSGSDARFTAAITGLYFFHFLHRYRCRFIIMLR